MKRCRIVASALLLTLLGGCAVPRADVANAATPGFTLTLYMAGTEKRYTWFELREDHVMGFSGGMDARQRVAKHDVPLNDQQMSALWQLIQKEGLLTADSAKAKKPNVKWELMIRHDGGRHSVDSVEDAIPGIRRLHDLLFSYQAAARYNLPGIGGH